MSEISGFRRIDMQIDHANQCFIDTMLDAHEGDYNGRTLRVQLTDGGAIKNTSGIKLNFGFMHTTANKNGVYAFQLINASQGIYEVAYPKEMLVPGNAVCAIQVVDGSSITSTKNFVVKIEKSVITNDVIVAENSPTVIEKALMNIADHEARVSLIELNFDNMLKLMTANIPNMDVPVSTRQESWGATSTHASRIDETISSRAPGSTALSNTIWTNKRAQNIDEISDYEKNIFNFVGSKIYYKGRFSYNKDQLYLKITNPGGVIVLHGGTGIGVNSNLTKLTLGHPSDKEIDITFPTLVYGSATIPFTGSLSDQGGIKLAYSIIKPSTSGSAYPKFETGR